MVAIIKFSEDEQRHVEFYERLRGTALPEWTWTTNRPRRQWKSGAHLLLIVTDTHRGSPQITRLGWLQPIRRVDDLNQKLEISRIYSVEPSLPISQLFNELPQQNYRHLKSDGPQTAKTGVELLKAMFKLRPEWREVKERIEGINAQHSIGSSAAAQVLAMQRDATIGVARMAGMDIASFAEWDPPPDPLADNSLPPNFASGLPVEVDIAREDQLINQDMQTILGKVTESTRHINWRSFEQHDQKLLVINANREPAEQVLGVDLIYYNISRKSLVLVQYKKLDARKNGYYYPDSDGNLDKELLRMRAVDRYVAANRRPGDEFRLLPTPSWIKICYPQASIPRSNDMAHGIYLARDHFEQLRNDPALKGSREGVRFGYQNLSNYLDNTMFIRLVETGFIGTAGTSTDLVEQQIVRSFIGKKALAIGVLTGDSQPQSVRNSIRRKG